MKGSSILNGLQPQGCIPTFMSEDQLGYSNLGWAALLMLLVN